jgi:hypothetical protein
MRVVGVFSTIILVLVFPALGVTQGVGQPTIPGPAGYSAPGTGFSSGLGSFGDFDVGGISVTPSARLGYQKLGMNVNLPLSDGFALDLQLQDSGMWMWGLGLAVNLTENVALFWRGDLSFGKTVTVRTEEEPYNAGARAVNWTGSNLQWGMSEAGAILRVWDGAYLLGGLRADRVLTRLADPRDQFGPISGGAGFLLEIALGSQSITVAGIANQEYWADFQSTTWMPYIGIGLGGPNCKWSLIGTPFAWVDTRIPLRLRQDQAFAGELDLGWLFYGFIFEGSAYDNELRYTFNKTGFFLESNFEYAQDVAPNLSLGIWCKGTWMKFRGTGTGGWSWSGEEVGGYYWQAFGGMISDSDSYYNQSSGSQSDSARGTITRFDYAGGLTALFTF